MLTTPPRWTLTSLAAIGLREETTAALELTLGLVMIEHGYEPVGMVTVEGRIGDAEVAPPPGWVFLVAQAFGQEVETAAQQDVFDVDLALDEMDDDPPSAPNPVLSSFCQGGDHDDCNGAAWDYMSDQAAPCACSCHGAP